MNAKKMNGRKMNSKEVPIISRRSFLKTATLSSAAAMLAPRHAFAQYGNTVNTMRKAAASATIVVKPLRNNISVLMGSGGNIAVLTGKDGKLLIDSGFAVSQSNIAKALASINSTSHQAPYQYPLACGPHGRQRMAACCRRRNPFSHKHSQAS